MKLRLMAVGQKMPAWVQSGFNEYAQRMPREFGLELIEIPLGPRGRGADAKRAQVQEAGKLMERSRDMHRVVLDERGTSWSSRDLSRQLAQWMQGGRDVALLVGGPDGHTPEVKSAADQSWSLSNLTLPHALVRVLIAEQLYRAWTLLTNHPYHRS